ncbi:MAG: 4-hydroxy-tetrahydrodipicolinate reductase [Oscillospiraceae bacterium]|jgi:4-hydroxy-tetrahydrodipicolinate reductase|nr:4-hydroxy-tetrahydrodipicolinate reductase [Oscillospiraceae bacterium]
MLNLIISGCNGYMGRLTAELAAIDTDVSVSAGISRSVVTDLPFKTYTNYSGFEGTADVLIDFSSPAAVDIGMLDMCVANNIPAVLCTTGYSDAQTSKIKTAAEKLPIFKTANFSIGINLLTEIVTQTAAKLGLDFDIEISEAHHRRKVDAPSGTALMLAEAARKGLAPHRTGYVFDRSSRREPRSDSEIGIISARGGTIPGEHTVMFAGRDEVIEFKHTVYSRDVFAAGAIRAAKFLADVREPGIYDKF